MPETKLVFYQEKDGEVPVIKWLKQLQKENRKAYANCIARIMQLASSGYELRRPAADYLRDGIYELRVKHIHVQYRILYFFHEQQQNVAILAHSIQKEDTAVSVLDLNRAIARRYLFTENPATHTYVEEDENGKD